MQRTHLPFRAVACAAALAVACQAASILAQDVVPEPPRAAPSVPARPAKPKLEPPPPEPEDEADPKEQTEVEDETESKEQTAPEAGEEPEAPNEPLVIAAPEPKAERKPPAKEQKPRERARCSPDESKRVLAQARASVVRVEAPLESALGIVFHSRAHVLTTFDAVRAGRGVRVTATDGIERGARVVAVDRERNLAILALEQPVSAPPLATGEAPSTGDPLLLLGRSYSFDESAREDVIVPGNVVATRAGEIRSDALDTPHETFGAPLFDCAGRAVALAVHRFDDRATLLSGAGLADSIGRAPEYEGDWSLEHFAFGMLLQADRTIADIDRLGVGLSLGTALIGEDRWYFPLRASLLAMAKVPFEDDPKVTRSGARVQLEAGFGYRFMLSGGALPFYLTPTVGAVAGYDRWVETTTRSVVTSSACSPAEPCATEELTDERIVDVLWARPAFGLALQLAPAEIGYQFLLDVEAPERSTHQWFFGIQF